MTRAFKHTSMTEHYFWGIDLKWPTFRDPHKEVAADYDSEV